MSYILDALKRADAQRERHAAPGLLAQTANVLPPSASLPATPLQRLLMLALPLAVLAAGLLATAWHWGAFDTPPVATGMAGSPAAVPPAPAAIAQAQAPTQAPAPTPQVPPAQAALPVAAAPAPIAAAPVIATPAPVPAPVAVAPPTDPEKSLAVELAQLPASVRQQLPSLSVSGSTYSSNPAHRLLILNGQVLREGDKLAPGHVLEQIKEKSALLNYQGTRYLLRF
ncbi:MAG: general secretion pathway protein GspB [Burkholderiales bacterium]